MGETPAGPKTHRLIRKDFVDPDERCHLCRNRKRAKRLSSGVAYIVVATRDTERTEQFGGPFCTKRSAINWGAAVPDLTRGAPNAPASDDPAAVPSDDDEPEVEADEKEREAAIRKDGASVEIRTLMEYLLLRCGRLAAHGGARYAVLDQLYAESSRRDLEARELRAIASTMRTAEERFPQWTYENLHDWYAYDCWFQQGLRRLPAGSQNAEYITSFLAQLRKKGGLSARQVEVAHNILGNYRLRAPRRDAFAWRMNGSGNS